MHVWCQQLYYDDILGRLYEKKVKYLIVGGLAVNLYGIPRVTQDIDIIISTDKENISRIVQVLTELGYTPRLPVDPMEMSDPEKVRSWIENRNLKAFSFYHRRDQFKVIDILLAHDIDFDRAFDDRTIKKFDDIEIYLISLKDLIEMKKDAGREQDQSDVRMLNRLLDMEKD